MQLVKLDETISIGGRITIADIEQLATTGYKGIICNCLDNEDFNQTSFAEIEAAVLAAGMNVCFVPISHSGMNMQDIEDFGRARAELGAPHPCLLPFGYPHLRPVGAA